MTNTSGLNHVKPNIGHDTVLRNGIRRKTYYFDATCLNRQLKKPMKEQKASHMTYALPISRLGSIECV